VCGGCTDRPAGTARTGMDGANVQLVDTFCYLVDMVSVDGDDDEAVEARVQNRWSKFRQLVPLPTNKNIFLFMRGKLNRSCVQSCTLHGNEGIEMN